MTTQEQVLVTGDIVMMDPARPRAEALAVQGGRIVAVGTREEARAALGAAGRRQVAETRTLLLDEVDRRLLRTPVPHPFSSR